MARVSKKQAEYNRECIIQVSSELFREKGFNAVSVNDLMAASGLTHGGFYGHFSSKEALEAIATGKAISHSQAQWQNESSYNISTLAAQYLSKKHRDEPKTGCAIAALATDVARDSLDKPTHAAYIQGVKSALEKLTSLSEVQKEGSESDQSQALVQLALLVGALSLSRATRQDEELSAAFLEAAQHALSVNLNETC